MDVMFVFERLYKEKNTRETLPNISCAYSNKATASIINDYVRISFRKTSLSKTNHNGDFSFLLKPKQKNKAQLIRLNSLVSQVKPGKKILIRNWVHQRI